MADVLLIKRPSRHPCLRQLHQLGRARRASSGCGYLVLSWFIARTVLTPHRLRAMKRGSWRSSRHHFFLMFMVGL